MAADVAATDQAHVATVVRVAPTPAVATEAIVVRIVATGIAAVASASTSVTTMAMATGTAIVVGCAGRPFAQVAGTGGLAIKNASTE